MPIRISCNFDAGAIEVMSSENPSDIRLRLRADQGVDGDGAFRQWFYFRAQGAAGQALRMVFEHAAESAYPDGWPGYRCVASYDRRHWFRIETTSYVDGQLVVEHAPQRDSIYYAYFEPYSHERHLDLLGWAAMSPHAAVSSLGATVDDRDVDLVTVGCAGQGRMPVWIIARQHPGESMAEWFVEGLLERLLDGADPVARRIRETAVLYIVPNMNPDGAIRGNLRTNALGVNLNREWHAPSVRRSPEVACVREAMEASGVELFLDIHGDESLPYVFFSTAEEVPGFSAAQLVRQARFVESFQAASPDFQTEQGYANGRFRDELLHLASKWVVHRFGCVSLTLEMPFKDNALLPDGLAGWNGERSKRLGAAMLAPILQHIMG